MPRAFLFVFHFCVKICFLCFFILGRSSCYFQLCLALFYHFIEGYEEQGSSNCRCNDITDRLCKEYCKFLICNKRWENKDKRNKKNYLSLSISSFSSTVNLSTISSGVPTSRSLPPLIKAALSQTSKTKSIS